MTVKLLYTPVEAARALGMSRSTVYLLLGRGQLRSVRIGTSRRIPASALEGYVDGLVEHGAEPLAENALPSA